MAKKNVAEEVVPTEEIVNEELVAGDEGEGDDGEGMDDSTLPEYMTVTREKLGTLDDETKKEYLTEVTKAMFGYAADFMNNADAFVARGILIGANRSRKAAVMFRKCVTSYRMLSVDVSRLKRTEKAEAKEAVVEAPAAPAVEKKAPAAKPAAKVEAKPAAPAAGKTPPKKPAKK